MFKRFSKDEKGHFATAFALMLAPLVLAAGAAVDYSRLANASTALQSVADSAALAANRYSLQNASDVQAAVNTFAQSQVNPSFFFTDMTTSSSISSDGRTITVTLNARVKNTVTAIFGQSYRTISATAQTIRGQDSTLEVALVLDNTGSMADSNKLVTAKSSANTLIDTLTADPNNRVKIGLVPFAQYVNVGTANRSASWMSGATDYSQVEQQCSGSGKKQTCKNVTVNYVWSGCVGSRPSPLNLSDDTPTTPYPAMMNTTCVQPIMPLTTNFSSLKTAINAMVANGNTYIPGGLVWGLNVVSPTAPFTEGSAYDPTNRKPRKAIVLMTDGENTASMVTGGAHTGSNRTDADKATASLCVNAKARNIELFTVAFMVTDTAAKAMLQACATDAAHYFDASDTITFQTAFKKIAYALQTPYLAR